MHTKIPDCFKRIVEELRRMPTPEQVKHQQALDVIRLSSSPSK
jgi:hypothetical protein